METSPKVAREELQNVIQQLHSSLSTVPLEDSITLHAVTPFPAVMQTTFGREVSLLLLLFTDMPLRMVRVCDGCLILLIL